MPPLAPPQGTSGASSSGSDVYQNGEAAVWLKGAQSRFSKMSDDKRGADGSGDRDHKRQRSGGQPTNYPFATSQTWTPNLFHIIYTPPIGVRSVASLSKSAARVKTHINPFGNTPWANIAIFIRNVIPFGNSSRPYKPFMTIAGQIAERRSSRNVAVLVPRWSIILPLPLLDTDLEVGPKQATRLRKTLPLEPTNPPAPPRGNRGPTHHLGRKQLTNPPAPPRGNRGPTHHLYVLGRKQVTTPPAPPRRGNRGPTHHRRYSQS